MSRPPSDFTIARRQAAEVRRQADPIATAKKAATRARQAATKPARDHLREAVAAMTSADKADAPESVRVPLRAAVQRAKDDLRAAVICAQDAYPAPQDVLGEMPHRIRKGSLEQRMRNELAAIRKGGYTLGTKYRLMEKVMEKYQRYADMADRERMLRFQKSLEAE